MTERERVAHYHYCASSSTRGWQGRIMLYTLDVIILRDNDKPEGLKLIPTLYTSKSQPTTNDYHDLQERNVLGNYSDA